MCVCVCLSNLFDLSNVMYCNIKIYCIVISGLFLRVGFTNWPISTFQIENFHDLSRELTDKMRLVNILRPGKIFTNGN